jgi:hypothetical protein
MPDTAAILRAARAKIGPQRCGICRWLDVPPDARGRRIPRKGKAYRCEFPVVVQPLPDSVTRAHDYRPPKPSMWMEPSNGTECPTFDHAIAAAERELMR